MCLVRVLNSVLESIMIISITGPPSIAISKSSSDCSLELKCSVQSSPEASLSWWYNGLLLDPQDNQVRMISSPSSLIIMLDACRLESVGEYVCQAENRFGVDRERHKLTREGVLEMERRNIQFNFIYQQALPIVSFSNNIQFENIPLSLLLFVNIVKLL